jgi:hypothetical protein
MRAAASAACLSMTLVVLKKEQALMRFAVPVLCTICLSGCINITNELQPSNTDVQAALMGEDCTPIVLGIGIGTNTVGKAQKDGRPYEDVEEFRGRINVNRTTTITRIRTVQLTEFYALLIGSRCIQVIGEP